SASPTGIQESLLSAPCQVLPVLPIRAGTETSDSAADDSQIYIPTSYEPNYAYPLIVWLAPSNGAQIRLHSLMSMISERKSCGVSVASCEPDEIEENLPVLFARLRRKYRLHTERVFLAGVGAAGAQALVTGLNQPDWFGGIAAFSARWPETPRLLR